MTDGINQTRLEGGDRMWKNMIKAAIVVISTGCAGYLIAMGLFVPESKEEALQTFRYEKDGEVVYTSRTEPEHIRTDGVTPSAYADNELIVQLAEGTSEREAKSIAGENQAELVGFISITDTCQWRFDEAYNLEELKAYADELTELPQIEAAYVNYFAEYESDAILSQEAEEWRGEPYYRWGYLNVHADAVWEYVDDMKDPVNIGILDGGFQFHDDLDYIIVRKGGKVTEVNDIKDVGKSIFRLFHLKDESSDGSLYEEIEVELEHGSHVTGIAAATCNNGIGIAGVYPDLSGEGEIYGYSHRYETGIEVSEIQTMVDIARMLLNDVKVVNHSWGEGVEMAFTMFREHNSDHKTSGGEAELAERAEAWEGYLGRMIDRGYEFLLVNSAGNASCHSDDVENGITYDYVQADEGEPQYRMAESGDESAVVEPQYNSPWLYIDDDKVRERIICVGAYNRSREIASFSNMGDRVDILAPGVDIYSTCNYDVEKGSGTSQAAPYVTGAAACIWSMDENLTASEVKTLLMQEMYIDQIRESITDKDINITKPVLDLENSMKQARRYVEAHPEKRTEADVKSDEKEIPEESEGDSEKYMKYLEEELIPEYGVMPVDEICKTSNGMDAWLEPTDLQGILAIEIDDYDRDGKREMLLIRGTCEAMDKQELFSSDDQGGGARIYMEMYECDGSVKLADSRELIPCGKYRVTYHEVQTGFFNYSNDGTVYIGIDNNFIMNETITTLALYQYRDETFQYVKGFCRRRQGSCYEAVLTADSEPEQTNITFAPTFTEDTRGWTILEDYDDEQASDSELEENALRLNEVYYEQLKTYGLNGKDVRLLWGERQWDARTADIYTSGEGNLKVMASIAECYEYSTSTECHLFREDPAGSLDAYR